MNWQRITDYLAEPIGDGVLVRNLPRGIALGIALIGFVGAGINQAKQSSSSPSPSSAADLVAPDVPPSATPSASPSMPIVISAADLWRAYDANEARAQATYGPGPVQVTGQVRSIDLDWGKQPTITLATPNDFMPVHVELLPADQPRALKLNKGDQVTVTCATTTIALGSPFIEKCSLR